MWKGRDCESAYDDSPLRQGDVLKHFIDGTERALFVVVTADCDIAQKKVSDAGLACVEMRPLKDFISDDHLSRQVSRSMETRRKELRDWIRKQWESKSTTNTLLTDRAINDWIVAASPAEIVSTLELTDKSSLRFVEDAMSCIALASHHLSGPSHARSKLQALWKLQKAPPKDWRQFVENQIDKFQPNQLPDDLFFVTGVPDESPLGFIVKLRSLTFVGQSSITTSVPEARERNSAYVRIARLSSTFKHGLAQQVGVLFARIGYPAEYESERDDIFALVTEDLCNELGDRYDDCNSN